MRDGIIRKSMQKVVSKRGIQINVIFKNGYTEYTTKNFIRVNL